MTTIDVPIDTAPDLEIDEVHSAATATPPTEAEEVTAEAVGAHMARLTADLGGSLGVLLTSLGTRSGLWRALDGAGPLTVQQVASKVTVDRALVRDWLRAQAAAGYLDYQAADDTFELSSAAAAAIPNGPGAPLVEACVQMFTATIEGFDDFSVAFGSGHGFGWHQRTGQHWHGQDAFTRLTVPDELIGSVIGALPDVASALNAGGYAVDVGCGYGAPTIAIAHQHPAARVLGVDYHDASVMQARDTAAQEGVDNVRFEVAAALDLPAGRGAGYDLITYFDSLHDLGDPRGALRRARQALAPSGAVLLFEPMSGDTVADNLNPQGRMVYSISTLICTPNAVSQRTVTSSEPLGAQAGEQTLRALAAEAGFSVVRRLDIPLPFNLVLELRP
jgi:2-polyprenyl-3-methyl-5-hydroxy-6-metoxy-1,4-benzoquinol methylase